MIYSPDQTHIWNLSHFSENCNLSVLWSKLWSYWSFHYNSNYNMPDLYSTKSKVKYDHKALNMKKDINYTSQRLGWENTVIFFCNHRIFTFPWVLGWWGRPTIFLQPTFYIKLPHQTEILIHCQIAHILEDHIPSRWLTGGLRRKQNSCSSVGVTTWTWRRRPAEYEHIGMFCHDVRWLLMGGPQDLSAPVPLALMPALVAEGPSSWMTAWGVVHPHHHSPLSELVFLKFLQNMVPI